jgi:hypothetical protein
MNGRIQKEMSALRRKATAESWSIEVKVLPKATAEPETEGSRP